MCLKKSVLSVARVLWLPLLMCSTLLAQGPAKMVKEQLIEKIQTHKARIGIVGLGYVGLPLVLRFGEERFSVIGFDVDPVKVQKLNAGESYIRHIPADRLQSLLK